MKVALLYATSMEAEPAVAALARRGRKETVASDLFQFMCRGQNGVLPIYVGIIGMGKDAAARGTRRLLDACAPGAAINVGIAGALTTSASVGGVYRVSEALDWRDGPGQRFVLSALIFKELPSLRLVTSNTPVFDNALRAMLADYGDMVDMEGATIAEVCAQRGVPCVQIKGISDSAGEGDRATLLENLASVSLSLSEVVVPQLIA